MSALDDVLAQPTGARFLRADLHVHSYGASHDVRDAMLDGIWNSSSLTPQTKMLQSN
jgi:hypothetical protein